MLEYENNVAPPTKTGTHVVLDYFRASFEFDNLDAENEEIVVREMVYEIGAFLGIPKEEISERNFKKDKYKYMFDLGVEMELGMIGPKAASGLPTCSLHLKGQGCREFEARCPNKTWGDFLSFILLDYEAKPSRIDIAIDDYDGDVVTMEWLKDKLERKQFTSTFKHKYHKIHGCVEEGFSQEMGSRNSSCQLMIYDKLKEQTVKKKKQVNQDYWVRYEIDDGVKCPNCLGFAYNVKLTGRTFTFCENNCSLNSMNLNNIEFNKKKYVNTSKKIIEKLNYVDKLLFDF